MDSKKLIFTILLIGLLSIFFINIQSNICTAENDNYKISLVEKKADYVKERIIGKFTYVYYDITVKLHNSGTDPSQNMIIKLKQVGWQNLTSDKEIIIGPGEYYTYFKEGYMVESDVQELYVEYYPTHLDYRNSQNTGETTLALSGQKNEENDSIPGFEITLFIISSIITLFFIKNNYKEKL